MGKHPALVCANVQLLADMLIDTTRLLEGTYGHPGLWRDLPPERADELEKLLGGFDFLGAHKAVRAYADAWQEQLDAEEAA